MWEAREVVSTANPCGSLNVRLVCCTKRLQFNYRALFRARGGREANSDVWVCLLDLPHKETTANNTF